MHGNFHITTQLMLGGSRALPRRMRITINAPLTRAIKMEDGSLPPVSVGLWRGGANGRSSVDGAVLVCDLWSLDQDGAAYGKLVSAGWELDDMDMRRRRVAPEVRRVASVCSSISNAQWSADQNFTAQCAPGRHAGRF